MKNKIKKELSQLDKDIDTSLKIIKDAVNSDSMPIEIKINKILTMADLIKHYTSQEVILRSILED